MSRAIAYQDLLELTWVEGGSNPAEGLDCFGVLLELYRRHGRPLDVPGLSRAWSPDEPGEAWELLGTESCRATRLLDVLVSSGPRGLHASTLVDEGNRLVLTSTKEHGVHALRAARVQGLIGVWRFRTAADLALRSQISRGGVGALRGQPLSLAAAHPGVRSSLPLEPNVSGRPLSSGGRA